MQHEKLEKIYYEIASGGVIANQDAVYLFNQLIKNVGLESKFAPLPEQPVKYRVARDSRDP